MFDWNDKDVKIVYRFKYLPFFPLLGSLILFCCSLRNMFIIPLTNWIICFCYSVGLRVVYILTPFNSFANYPTITPFTVFLIAVFVASWVSFIVFAWDIHLVSVLKDLKGYKRYRDVKNLVQFLMGKGGGKKLMVIMGPMLLIMIFLFATGWILSWVFLYTEQITSIFFWLLLSATLLNILYTFIIREFIREHASKSQSNN